MKKIAFTLCWFLACTTATCLYAAEESGQDIPDEVVKKVDPSVVAIQHERAGGSGFVITEDGYILSNGHVVRGSDDEDPMEPAESITVIMNTEKKYPAKVIGFCMNPDVAVLKIDPDEPLQPVEFANTSKAKIGQKCFAVGTPVGLKRTFTSGILSNVERTDLGTFTKVFQTDAAINPGNSGGPLFDREGRVLGINTYASRGNNNLGFTIPMHVVDEVKDDILEYGRFVRAEAPLFYSGELYDELARALGVTNGFLVHYVMDGSPIARAGMKAGDVVVAIDGEPCSARTEAELMDIEWGLTIREVGKPVTFTVLRGAPDARETLDITVIQEESEPEPSTRRFPGEIVTHRYDALGLSFVQLVRRHRIMYGIPDAEGVMVMVADPESVAGNADLMKTDVITGVGGKSVSGVDDFRREIESHCINKDKAIEVTVVRRKTVFHTVLAPYYDLGDKKLAMVVPPGNTEYLDLLRQELVAHGAQVTMVTESGDGPELDVNAEIPVIKLQDLDAADYDVLLFADTDDDSDWWRAREYTSAVKIALKEKKVIAAIGASAMVIVANGDEEVLEKKITTSEGVSSAAIKLGANYTGNDVEKDGKIITATGKDRKTVREFITSLLQVAVGM